MCVFSGRDFLDWLRPPPFWPKEEKKQIFWRPPWSASNLWKFNLRGDPPCWQRWPGELPSCVSLVLQPWSRLVRQMLQIATLNFMQRTTCCLSTELAWRKVRTRPTQTIMPTIAFVMIRLTKTFICQTAVAKESGIEHRKTHPCHVQKQTSQGLSGGKVCT